MLLRSKATKVIALLCIMALAITAIIPSGFVMPKVWAEETTQTWDFRDGSVIPNDTSFNGNYTITSGNMTIKCGTSNAYGYNGSQHGAIFKAGNTIEIKVDGATKLTIGDCTYTNGQTPIQLTVKSEDGSYEESNTTCTGCYDGKGNGELVYTYTGGATTLIIEFTNTTYVPVIIAEPLAADPVPEDRSKIDVWDFGAAELDTATYNNMLTVDIINGFYDSSVTPGSTNVSIGSFETPDGQLVWNGGGKTNHRIRTTNEAITRYDSKSATIDGVTLTGYIYSNSSSTSDVYLAITLYEGDILTVYTGSNGNPSTISFEGPDGEVLQTAETGGSGAKNVFYAPKYGVYKLYTLNEKLVVYRALREHTNPVTVSGSVDTTKADGIGSSYKISFTNQKTGAVTEAAVADGKYSVTLFDNYTYDLALVDANGYVISSDAELEVPKGSTGVTDADITIEQVDLVTITGNITGIASDKLANLKLEFLSDNIYVPEITVNSDGTFTLKLEKGVTYDVAASGVNDYDLTTTTISATADGTKNIEFSAKPVYTVTVTYTGLPDSVKSKATVIFTNIEDGYTYTFAPGDKIELRDGQYSVVVKNYGEAAVVQKLTSDLKVSGAAVSKTIEFEEVTVWDFAKYNTSNGGNPGIDADKAHYLGLVLTNANENKTFLLVSANGEVKIPVTKGQLVTITYCYSADFEISGVSYTTDNSTGSTTKTDVVRVAAEEDGYLTVSVNSTTYFNSFAVSDSTEYKEKITVGTDKEYQTINDALAAVAKMSRPNNERVEIVIDPGNYEEMLVIDVPNVSLVNAAGSASSLEIIDKGVNIGKNVVRITSYYGHGYNYYSMGSDCKWDADVLAANQANGSYTTTNPGSGTTNGSYWNATVVVTANGFEANGIVFENSFNQYISAKEAADTVVEWATGGKGTRPTTAGDTSVQNKSFVERAAALAIVGDQSVFVNCKFIGRQDTLYGGTNIKAAFHKCDILGGTDYIFGGMTAVFYKCNLVMNTSETSTDVAYITAAQQSTGRGYLMYECTVTSTTPGVDTASATRSKPGYFGRPWAANTSEVVFFNTTVETTDFNGTEESLIVPAGWLDTLSGQSSKMYEYGTIEESGEDNSASRVTWATLLSDPTIDDGATDITIAAFLGDWTDELQARDILTESEIIELEDNGVSVEFDADALPEGVDPEDVVFSAELVSDENGEYTYDLKFLVDGEEIKINGEVTVKLPLPEEFADAEKVYVYYKNGETYVDMNAVLEDGYLVFTTDHFSEYVITTEVKGSTDEPSTESPETGVMPIVPIAAVAIISAAAALFVIIKRRRAK